jgi:hypothetical protein
VSSPGSAGHEYLKPARKGSATSTDVVRPGPVAVSSMMFSLGPQAFVEPVRGVEVPGGFGAVVRRWKSDGGMPSVPLPRFPKTNP